MLVEHSIRDSGASPPPATMVGSIDDHMHLEVDELNDIQGQWECKYYYVKSCDQLCFEQGVKGLGILHLNIHGLCSKVSELKDVIVTL